MNGKIILQLIFFYALFTLMVKIGVGSNALNGLYFYPEPVRDKVYELGLTDRETVAKKRGILTLIWIAGAAIVAGIVALL